MLEAVAAAGRTAARSCVAPGVEAEGARRVAALLRNIAPGEQVADRVEGADVADRVGARRLADRRLVDHRHLGDALGATDSTMPARRLGRLALLLAQRGVEHVLHQRRLARPRDAGDADQAVERQGDVEVLQVVFLRAEDFEPALSPGPSPASGRGERNSLAPPGRGLGRGASVVGAPAARQILRRQRLRRSHFLRSAEEHHLAAALAGARAHVEQAVGFKHDLRVVLDHHQRIAGVAQAAHDADDAAHVARVQADGRLVEHEQGVHQRSAERRGEVDALHLAAGEGARLAVERQVAEADLAEIIQARADLAEQQVGGLVQRGGQGERGEEVAATVDRQQHQVVKGEAFLAQLPQQRLRLQARAAAGRAGRVGAVARQQHADVHLVGLGFQPGEEMLHAVPVARPGALQADVLRVALQHPAPVFGRQVAPGDVGRHAALLREAQQVVLALAVGLGLPGLHRAAGQRLRFIRHHQAVVDADDAAEAAAALAGAERGVEGEAARRRFRVVDVAVGTVQVGGEFPHLPLSPTLSPQAGRGSDILPSPACGRGVGGEGLGIHIHPPLSDAQRRLQCLDDAGALGIGEAEAVLHHFERFPVAGMDARVALRLQQAQHLLLAEVVRHLHREGDDEARVVRRAAATDYFRVDALRRVAPHRPAAAAAEQPGPPRVEQLEVVVQFRHGADGGARGAHRVGLVDGDGRRDAVDAVDLRLVHAVEELPRVGREGLDVAALALGVERVEDQRALARAGDAGDDDEFAGGKVEVEVLQVVLARAADGNDGLLLVGHLEFELRQRKARLPRARINW
ncbi:MAG: hypothetical protein MOGDAGHF_00007 [Rhodocyclaceae bacterium]|nr:hypothetical protein [Rhodocyclaceae bacterium]